MSYASHIHWTLAGEMPRLEPCSGNSCEAVQCAVEPPTQALCAVHLAAKARNARVLAYRSIPLIRLLLKTLTPTCH